MKCALLLLRKFHGINLDGYDGLDRYDRFGSLARWQLRWVDLVD
jgi:hypothetical protein